MTICIVNCYHWIGFHLANEFLEMGQEVIGIDQADTDFKENLAMFLGRNSAFQCHAAVQPCHTIIVVPKFVQEQGQAAATIQITNKMETREVCFEIQHPFLYGEWMPMTSEAGCCQGISLKWHTQAFSKKAIWIRDFTKMIRVFLKAHVIPERLELVSSLDPIAKMKDKRSIVLVRSTDVTEKKAALLDHFQRFSFLYQANGTMAP